MVTFFRIGDDLLQESLDRNWNTVLAAKDVLQNFLRESDTELCDILNFPSERIYHGISWQFLFSYLENTVEIFDRAPGCKFISALDTWIACPLLEDTIQVYERLAARI